METYFAPAEKADIQELTTEIEIVSQNPVMSGLLHSIGGLLAILDEHRQIVALNDSFLELLGIQDPSAALGLRLGEAVGCIHAHDAPGHTCGSTQYCSTCGAVIAMVTSLGTDSPAERICALTARKGGQPIELALLVRCQPIRVNEKRFLLVFLQDITKQQQRAALERTFFHDINNMLAMLSGASQLLHTNEPSELSETIRLASVRLIKEVAIQQCLSAADGCSYQPLWSKLSLGQIIKELRAFFANHPIAHGKHIEFPEANPEITVRTDLSLVLRVLCNMLLNALEATEPGGSVRVSAERKEGRLVFNVWNPSEIPPHIENRIFQRNFSTKAEAGRGIGTYSMKLFGEKILGGNVDFTTSKAEGTTFRLALPI